MEDLFPETKIRRTSRVMMHVLDAGNFPSGQKCIWFKCPKCEFETEWIPDEWSVSQNKKGHPCPVCNPPAVHNKRANTAPYNAEYVGRGSLWGNPYQIGEDGNREEVIELFRRNVLPRLDLAPLVGKHLVCYCAPAACHADLLLEEAAKLQERSRSFQEFGLSEFGVIFGIDTNGDRWEIARMSNEYSDGDFIEIGTLIVDLLNKQEEPSS